MRRGKNLAALVCGLFAAAGSNVFGQVEWHSGGVPRSGRSHAEMLDVLDGGLRASRNHVVVQFDEPVTPQHRAALDAAGVKLLAYLGDNAFFASARPAGIDRAALAADAHWIDAQPIAPQWKLHSMLAAGDTPTWAVLPATAGTANVWISAYILFHDDVSRDDAMRVAAAHGAQVHAQLQTMNLLFADVSMSAIAALADDDAVQYIEPAMPALEPGNAQNRALTGADIAQSVPYELDGSGVVVLVYDGGAARASHVDFGGRLTVMDTSTVATHPTHVCGTIGGSGAASGGLHRGMAPGVTILSYGLSFPGSGTPFVTNLGDIEADYTDAVTHHGAMIANNSIGLNTAANGYSCTLEGDYTAFTALIDGMIRGSLGAPFRVVWANGNERGAVTCGTTYRTVPPPATAKNQLAVGAVNANDDSMTTFSSWGPTDDGRLRPDVSAPGCQIGGDSGVTSTSDASDTAYATYCGTSMASPTVCGLSALLLEDFRAHNPLLPLPRNSTLRAVYAHTAVDRGNAGPDYQFGYGSVRIIPAIELMRAGDYLEGTLTQAQVFTRYAVVATGTSQLKFTMAWDDYPGTPNVSPALVNDLDLRVLSPSGVRAWPWTLSSASPGNSAVRTQADHVNNMEQVLVDNPEPGTWTVEVVATNVPQGPQSFSLAGLRNVQTAIVLPQPAPEIAASGASVEFDVAVLAIGENVVPGSPRIHYRFGPGPFFVAPLIPLGGANYHATIPGALCGETPEYFFSAAGDTSGEVLLPANAPTSLYHYEVGQFDPVFVDNFETDLGWVASGTFADGPWQRGVPANWGRADPPADFDSSGQCYLTDNDPLDSNSDVDNGTTILTSPPMDATGRVRVSYAYWLNDIPASQIGPEDSLRVEVATDAPGTNWQPLRTYPTALAQWRTDMLEAPPAFTGTATTRFRFLATEVSPSDVMEAAVDAFALTVFTCNDAAATCADGVRNQGETRVDCGGPCAACACTTDADCDDGIACNGAEVCDGRGACLTGYSACGAAAWCNPAGDACVPHGDGDLDLDGDRDLADYARFQECIGKNSLAVSACTPADLVGSGGAVDLDDYAGFAALLDAGGPQ